MTIIEQAAKRLEALRRAGIEVPSFVTERRPQDQESLKYPAQVDGEGGTVSARPVVVAPIPKGVFANGVADPVKATRNVRPRAKTREVELDLDRLSRAGQLTPNAGVDLAQLAAEYRIIKRPLMKSIAVDSRDPAKRTNLIMVTSSLPGEGKTFSALNLAMSLAMEVDRTVLLVDADVVRPSILERCGLPPSKGLMDVLTEPSMELGEVLLRTNVAKLTLLPAGTPHANATELLASAAMERLLDELSHRYSERIVIFDAPPVLASPEARVLAAHVGQVVVVVEQGGSSKEAVQRAFSMLRVARTSCRYLTSVVRRLRALFTANIMAASLQTRLALTWHR